MKKYLLLTAMLLGLSGCALYKQYESTSEAPVALMGEGVEAGESMAVVPWRTFFPDAQLQALIEEGLEHNSNLKISALNIEIAEVSLQTARLAWLPSLNLTPSFQYQGSASYNVGAGLQWDLDFFGGISSRRRQAQALLAQVKDEKTAVQTRLVADIAKGYHMLQMQDRQLDLMDQAIVLWEQSLDIQRTLMENGKAYSTSVNQMEASLLGVRAQRADLANDIRDTENALCVLLGRTPGHVEREPMAHFVLPVEVGLGLPGDLLRNRADIRAAEHGIEKAYYVQQEALSNFFPKITLDGNIGLAGVIGSPAGLAYSAIASLAQPLFNQGRIRGNYKAAQIRQEQAREQFIGTVLKAGSEVNSLIADCETAAHKAEIFSRQIDVLQKAFDGTHELMKNGKANYLEVITAQEAFLKAQLSEVANTFNGNQAIINLYIALGGGVE
ncbi:MAG: efflux transporter outer membrane subunit [Bacteroidales bacterium]|nr:efflux transporter outer membrane subunit [Bacteroidales bacterium]